MSYKQFRNYKDHGTKCGKLKCVYNWWDCVNMNEAQYKIYSRWLGIYTLAIGVLFGALGFCIGSL